ncbi:MAG: outer membrane lipoprotein-sorting protein [Ignavibacteria bacterium]|nr:outer membrane lipoprotein-sorting protein [Bacteroidota bacterium]MSQ45896.1 outer membrane lipoprotein-sorting protein [Ignavibacteria bacterium]
MKKIFLFIYIFFYSQQLISQFKDAEQIIDAIRIKYDEIKDYTATIEAAVDMERIKVPKMDVKIYFKQPDKFHIESKNFAMIPREGVAINPAELLNKFNAKLLGIEQLNSRPVYKIQLTPKSEQKLISLESYVYIDQENLYIVKLASTPSEGRTIVINFSQSLVQNKYYLPSKIFVKFDNAETNSSQRLPRSGSVTISYKNYLLNTGLSDSLFTKKSNNLK